MTTARAPGGLADQLEQSRRIAAYVGPVLVILAVSEARNIAIWNEGDPALTYLAGLVWFMGGLALVLVHNRWSRSWPVTITLAGWFFLVGGAFRLLFPEAQQGNANTPAAGVYAIDVLLGGAGLIMSFQAFRPRGRWSMRPRGARLRGAG